MINTTSNNKILILVSFCIQRLQVSTTIENCKCLSCHVSFSLRATCITAKLLSLVSRSMHITRANSVSCEWSFHHSHKKSYELCWLCCSSDLFCFVCVCVPFGLVALRFGIVTGSLRYRMSWTEENTLGLV
jgi:hypothetical protein